MIRLSRQRIEELKRFLQETKVDRVLLPELLDHLACEVEERLWEGEPFEEVLAALRGEVTVAVVQDLNHNPLKLLAMNASMNEIIFEGRNKAYGAYVLRSRYPRNIRIALMCVLLLMALAVALPKIFGTEGSGKVTDRMVETDLERIFLKEQEPEVVLPPPVREAVPVQKQVRYLPPEVVTDLVEETPLPTIEQMETAQISAQNVEGENFTEDLILPPTEMVGPAKGDVIELKGMEEKEFLKAEQQPEYEGGSEAFRKFLEKNLRYPPQAARANVQGKVFLQFSVMTDGSIANVEVIKGIGYGCDEEAVRVVRLMPKWRPGKQAGRPVRVRYTLPIQFALAE